MGTQGIGRGRRATALALGCLFAAAAPGTRAQDRENAAPLSVDECVAIALANSDALGQAAGGVESARGAHLADYRVLLPTLGVSATWGRDYQQYRKEIRDLERQAALAAGKPLPDKYDGEYSGQMTLQASQTILSLPGLQSWRASERVLEAARNDYRAALSDVELNVRQQFYMYLGTVRIAEVEAQAARIAREQLRRSEVLFRLGSVARTDVLQAQVNLSEAERTSVLREHDGRIELARLALVMGLDPNQSLVVDTTLAAPGPPPEGDVDFWVSQALARRADLAASRQRLLAAELAVTGAKQARLPELSATAAWWRYATDGDDPLLDKSTTNQYNSGWMVSLELSTQLFNGLLTEGRIEAAKGDRLTRRETVERQEKDIALEVREAYLDISAEMNNLEAARAGMRLAAENLRLQQALYESGAGTLLEWDNARLALRRARLAAIQAEISLVLAHARFSRAVAA